MGNYFCPMCCTTADDDTEMHFNDLHTINQERKTTIVSSKPAILEAISENGYEKQAHSAEEINQMSAPTTVDILPLLKPVDYSDDEDREWIFSNEGDRVSSKTYVSSYTTEVKSLKDVISHYEVENTTFENMSTPLSENVSDEWNNDASEISEYVHPFQSQSHASESPTFQIRANSSFATLDETQLEKWRDFDYAPTCTYSKESSDSFSEKSEEESDTQMLEYYSHKVDIDDKEYGNSSEDTENQAEGTDYDASIPDITRSSINDNLFWDNTMDLDSNSDHVSNFFPNKSSSCQNLAEQLYENSDSGDPDVLFCSSSESAIEMTHMPRKRVSFNPIVKSISLPDFLPVLSINHSKVACVPHPIIRRAASSRSAIPQRTFFTQFRQPAADYASFYNRLETSFVSLENVMYRENVISGSIKVKYLGGEISVFLRCTLNSWETCFDVPAVHAPDSAPSRYMTYNFEFTIPIHCRAIFAVCYEAGDLILWDNNDGFNYEFIPAHNSKQCNF